MEYVQTVLVQIEATRFSEASRPQGLVDELDEHRKFLEQQPGFRDMRVTRSINAEGNLLLVVETRWRDADTLVEYETGEPTVSSIIGKHQELIVPESLQVLDMEALRTEAWRGPAHTAEEVRERIALPLLVPLGVLAFALLVIYGLSRVYLDIPSDVATPLAAGIAVGILAVSWYLASRPSVPGWQIGSIMLAAAGLLLGGGIYAAVHEEDETEAVETTPTPAATASPAPGGGGLLVTMGDNFFDREGQRNPTIDVAAGEETTLDLENGGVATHNMRIAGLDGKYENLGAPPQDDFVSDPDIMGPGATGSITFKIDQPGIYDFRCDFHPQQMTGKLDVK